MAYGPGHGSVDLGIGANTVGILGRLNLYHRIDARLYAGAEGRLSYSLSGPRRHQFDGQILGIFGGTW